MGVHLIVRLRLFAFLLLAVAGSAVFASLGAAPASKPPNVLLITIDTLRFDRVGIHSAEHVRTPHLDALARRSAVFTRAYAHNPLTRPSHANIMTGTTSLYHGVTDNPGFRLEDRYLTIAEHLRDAAYETAAFIGAFVLDDRFGLDKGFDRYDDDNGIQTFGALDFVERTADRVVGSAMDWIGRRRASWFAWVHLFDPHDPYEPPEPFRTEYRDDPYSGEVAFVDAQLGVLFEFLEARGDLEDTIIVVTSDHGEAFGEKEELYHGFFAYDNTLHVPLILYRPGAPPATVAENAAHVDIFPTVCELTGRPVPKHIQGESLLPLIQGRARLKERIYFESLTPHLTLDAAPLSGFIRGDLKYIDQPIPELYDLAADPGEAVNLAPATALDEFAAELAALRKSLKGKGTAQDTEGRHADIAPLMKSLGYIAGQAPKKGTYGIEDDLKSLQPLIANFRLAVEDVRAGRGEAAEKKLRNLIRIRPTYISAYSTLAFNLYDRGRAAEALDVLKEGLGRVPDSLLLTDNLGVMRLMTKDYEAALEPLEECAKRDRFNPDHFNYLGRALMELGRFAAAEKQFRQALDLDPELVPALNNMGYLNLILYTRTAEDKYYDSAIRCFDAAVAREPGLASALKGRETAHEYQEKFAASDPEKKRRG